MQPEFSPGDMAYLRDHLLAWGRANFADFPWRHVTNRWHALAAEMMLQRTRAEQVVPAFENFVNKYPTPAELAADENSAVFANLGLYWREAQIRKLAKVLTEREIPESREELMALPGIGDYVCGAFRSMHLRQHDWIIDANVVRLYGRFFGFATDGETRRKRWFMELAQQMTPPDNARDYNYAMLDFTREICRTAPLCEQCPVRQRCAYYQAKSA
jgi:A/G-specific adenine glycosylase